MVVFYTFYKGIDPLFTTRFNTNFDRIGGIQTRAAGLFKAIGHEAVDFTPGGAYTPPVDNSQTPAWLNLTVHKISENTGYLDTEQASIGTTIESGFSGERQ